MNQNKTEILWIGIQELGAHMEPLLWLGGLFLLGIAFMFWWST